MSLIQFSVHIKIGRVRMTCKYLQNLIAVQNIDKISLQSSLLNRHNIFSIISAQTNGLQHHTYSFYVNSFARYVLITHSYLKRFDMWTFGLPVVFRLNILRVTMQGMYIRV